MLCNQLLLFLPDPNLTLFFITPLLSCPWLFRSVLLTRTLGIGPISHVLTKHLIITCKGEFT